MFYKRYLNQKLILIALGVIMGVILLLFIPLWFWVALILTAIIVLVCLLFRRKC